MAATAMHGMPLPLYRVGQKWTIFYKVYNSGIWWYRRRSVYRTVQYLSR